MKVFCINDTGEWIKKSWLYRLTKKWVPASGPDYGDVLTTEGEYYEDGEKYLFLIEWPKAVHEGFLASEFIPIQDEESSVEERQRMEDGVERDWGATKVFQK